VEQLKTAVLQKADKLKVLVDEHCNQLIDNLGDFRQSGLTKYREERIEIDRCSTLTEQFRKYAAEVLFNNEFESLFCSYCNKTEIFLFYGSILRVVTPN
jgi:hypothetical protein